MASRNRWKILQGWGAKNFLYSMHEKFHAVSLEGVDRVK